MRGLTNREQKFVDCFIRHNGNLRTSAIEAGYSEKGAARAAFRLLKKSRVKEAIDACKARLAAENNYTRERMAKELQDIIRDASMGEYPNYAAVLKAKEMLCKMFGFFEPEKQEINNYDVSISVLDKDHTPPRPPEAEWLHPQIPDLSEATDAG